MTTTKRFSTGLASIVLFVVLAVIVSGCSSRGAIAADSGVQIPPRVSVGAENWLKGIETFRADALVTHYDADGRPDLSRQVIDVDVDRGTISASCDLPAGSWWARDGLGGWYNPVGWGVMFRYYLPMAWGQDRRQALDTLEIIAHRVRGPINLSDGEKVTAVEDIFTAGFSTWRLSSRGCDLASAYFFDKTTGSLRMVSTGGIQATDSGTITVYSLGYAENGAMIPVGFEVKEIGSNSIIGSRTLMTVTFENIVTE